MIEEMSTSDVHDIISRLRFISKIKQDEKIDTAHFVMCNTSLLSRLYRTFIVRGESRQTALSFIRESITKAFDLLDVYRSKKDNLSTRVCELLLENMKACTKGIENMCRTYASDKMIVSILETQLRLMEAKISTYTLS